MPDVSAVVNVLGTVHFTTELYIVRTILLVNSNSKPVLFQAMSCFNDDKSN